MVVKPQSAHARAGWRVLRWSLMAAAVFWMLVYRLGTVSAELPEFAYVNF